jgi:hypothetical protein
MTMFSNALRTLAVAIIDAADKVDAMILRVQAEHKPATPSDSTPAPAGDSTPDQAETRVEAEFVADLPAPSGQVVDGGDKGSMVFDGRRWVPKAAE